MNEGYVLSQIRRANRNLFRWNGILLLIVAGVAVGTHAYLYNFFFGPFERDLASLPAGKDADPGLKYFCTITGDEVVESGLQRVSQTRRRGSEKVVSEKVTADYLVLRDVDRLLIVKAPPGNTQRRTFTGALVDLPEEVRSKILEDVEDARVRTAFLPLMLDATGFRGPGYWGLGIGVPLLLLSLTNLVRTGLRSGDPQRHPTYRKLSAWGEPETIVAHLDQEMAGPDARTVAPCTISPSWLAREHAFGVDVMPLAEIAWAYIKKTEHRRGGVKTGDTYEACLNLRTGKPLIFRAKEEQLKEILSAVCERVPWVVAGYSEELEQLWKTQREEFVAQVDRRREVVMNPQNWQQEDRPE